MSNHVVKGAENIADVLKIQSRDILWLKENHGLPVWKLNGKGPWRSTQQKLLEWADSMAEKKVSTPPT